jgi:hypothetical protein
MIVALYIILFVIIAVIAIDIQQFIPESSCTGDCDQGRRCTCVNSKE